MVTETAPAQAPSPAEATQTSPPATQAPPSEQNAELEEGRSILKDLGVAGGEEGTEPEAKGTEPPETQRDPELQTLLEKERAVAKVEATSELQQEQDSRQREQALVDQANRRDAGIRTAFRSTVPRLRGALTEAGLEDDDANAVVDHFQRGLAGQAQVLARDFLDTLFRAASENLPKAEQEAFRKEWAEKQDASTPAFLAEWTKRIQAEARKGYRTPQEHERDLALDILRYRNKLRENPELLFSTQGGPEQREGQSGVGKAYIQMTPEERARLTPEERDRLVALSER